MTGDTEPRALMASFDAVTSSLIIGLANGCTFTVPISRIPELTAGSPQQLAAVQIDLEGEALVWDEPNVCVSVPGLIMEAVGGWEQWAARHQRRRQIALARKGGQTKSAARAAASRQNGQKGGRPRKGETA